MCECMSVYGCVYARVCVCMSACGCIGRYLVCGYERVWLYAMYEVYALVYEHDGTKGSGLDPLKHVSAEWVLRERAWVYVQGSVRE